jgi:hypothetical protein
MDYEFRTFPQKNVCPLTVPLFESCLWLKTMNKSTRKASQADALVSVETTLTAEQHALLTLIGGATEADPGQLLVALAMDRIAYPCAAQPIFEVRGALWDYVGARQTPWLDKEWQDSFAKPQRNELLAPSAS